MRPYFLFLMLACSAFVFSCQSKNSSSAKQEVPQGVNQITAGEVIHGSTYTYIKGNKASEQIWVAVRKQTIEEGKTYYYKQALEMKDFHSKELDRVFPVIYFLNSISDEADAGGALLKSAHANTKATKRLEVSFEKEAGITSLSELFAQKENFAGKTITVRGKVAKFNENILGKNWIHIQDGSEYKGSFDLTITSAATVSVGQIVRFKGTIVLDKDFGAGYRYDVLMENAGLQ